MWGGVRRREEVWGGGVGRCGEMWGDVKRRGEVWGDMRTPLPLGYISATSRLELASGRTRRFAAPTAAC